MKREPIFDLGGQTWICIFDGDGKPRLTTLTGPKITWFPDWELRHISENNACFFKPSEYSSVHRQKELNRRQP